MKIIKVIISLLLLNSVIYFSQETRRVFPIAGDSTFSEINPYLTHFWYGNMINQNEIITAVQKSVKPIWLTFVETDFENFNKVVAYNIQIDGHNKIQLSNKFIISDTFNNIKNRHPKIENFLSEPVAIWEGKDSVQTDLYYSVYSDSEWTVPQKITNDTLTEKSTIFFTRDAWELENQNNSINYLFWLTGNAIKYTTLSNEFIWDSVATLYSTDNEINDMKFRMSYNGDSYLLFIEKIKDSCYVKSFVKYNDSTNWIGPITIVSSDDFISQIESNIQYDFQNSICLTYVENNVIKDTSFIYEDSLEFLNDYNEQPTVNDSIYFTSNTLLTGGCIISPTPYFLISTKIDTGTMITISPNRYSYYEDNYGPLFYNTKRRVGELTMSGLWNTRFYAASWSEYDKGQYDIYCYIDFIEFGSVYDKKSNNNFLLSQNYPNPFNPTTTIEYSIPKETHSHQQIGGQNLIPSREGKERSGRPARQVLGGGVFITLKVYDLLGKEVTTLVNQKQNPGNYKVMFDASNLSSGVYYYRLKSGNYVKTKKMLLIK